MTYPLYVAMDVILGVLFVVMVICSMGALSKFSFLIVVPLAAIYVDHVLLANGAGFLFILFDLPVMLILSIFGYRQYRNAKRCLVGVTHS